MKAAKRAASKAEHWVERTAVQRVVPKAALLAATKADWRAAPTVANLADWKAARMVAHWAG